MESDLAAGASRVSFTGALCHAPARVAKFEWTGLQRSQLLRLVDANGT